MNDLRTIEGGAGRLAVAYGEPPVTPPVGRPMAAVPTPIHSSTSVGPMAAASPAAPVQPDPPAVAPAPEPAPAAQAPAQAEAVDETVAVFLHLSSGERIWAGRFGAADLAEQRASEIIDALNRPQPGVWARFGDRLIRPSAVVSIELAPRREG